MLTRQDCNEWEMGMAWLCSIRHSDASRFRFKLRRKEAHRGGRSGAAPGREKEDAGARSTEAFNPIHFVFLSPTVSQDSQHCAALALALSFLSFSLFFLQRINQIVITALSVTELRQNHSKRDHSFERGSDSAGGTEAVITQSGRDFDFDLRVSIAIHHCQLS